MHCNLINQDRYSIKGEQEYFEKNILIRLKLNYVLLCYSLWQVKSLCVYEIVH
jgi:hypothetical protein